MNYRTFLALMALTLLGSQSAWGHGFTISLSGNSLQAASGDPPSDANPNVFAASLDDVGGVLQIDHGAAGGGSAFIQGRHFRFDVRGPLWYSNGGAAVSAAPGVKITITDQQQAPFLGQSISETGSSTGLVPGYPITGLTSHEFIWTLSLDPTVPGAVSSIPDGVYGIGYFVGGGVNGGPDFTPTPLLLTAFATPVFNPDPLNPNPNVDLADLAIYTAAVAAVPEPASVALLGTGLAILAGAAGRRRRKG